MSRLLRLPRPVPVSRDALARRSRGCEGPGWSEPYVRHGLWWASHSRLEPFEKFARTIREHLDGILAWTRLRVPDSALEGMNGKGKLLSHRACGSRTAETCIAAIRHGCGEPSLEGSRSREMNRKSLLFTVNWLHKNPEPMIPPCRHLAG